jgi:hypothetical protein
LALEWRHFLPSQREAQAIRSRNNVLPKRRFEAIHKKAKFAAFGI